MVLYHKTIPIITIIPIFKSKSTINTMNFFFLQNPIIISLISIVSLILFLVIFSIILIHRRLKSYKNKAIYNENDNMKNTNNRFIAQTAMNITSSPGKNPNFQFLVSLRYLTPPVLRIDEMKMLNGNAFY